MNIIPAIDLKDGKCVRLYQGDFEQVTEYSDDPVAVARDYAACECTDLHIVDLDGARSGDQQNRDLVKAISEATDMSIQLGGGLRDKKTVEEWLASSVSRCVIGSLAVTDPDVVKSWLVRFGPERIVLALDVQIDATGEPLLTTHGWTQASTTSVYECIDDFGSVGLKHVLCTDVSRDGAMSGPNIELYASLMRRFPDLELQASGGVRDIDDIATLHDHKIPAAITGRALLEGKITAEEIGSFLRSE